MRRRTCSGWCIASFFNCIMKGQTISTKATAAQCVSARSAYENCSSASASTLFNDIKSLQGFTRQAVSLTKQDGRASFDALTSKAVTALPVS
jgi:hypothetical protein